MPEKIGRVYARVVADLKEYGMAVIAFFVYAVIVNLLFRAFCPLVIFCGFPCP